jgi:hypothetical protein
LRGEEEKSIKGKKRRKTIMKRPSRRGKRNERRI